MEKRIVNERSEKPNMGDLEHPYAQASNEASLPKTLWRPLQQQHNRSGGIQSLKMRQEEHKSQQQQGSGGL